MSISIAWRRHWIAAARLELDVIDGPPLVEEQLEQGAQLFQGVDPLVLGLRYGAGQTLAAWRQRFAAWPPATFEAELPVTVGRLPAIRLEANVMAAEGAEGAFLGPEGEYVYERRIVPARAVVAFGFQHGDIPIIAHWSAPAAVRADYLDAEHHFFGALVPL